MSDQWARLEILCLVQRCNQLEAENARLRRAVEHITAAIRRAEEGCPAGGEHVWIVELPEDYYLLTGRRRSTTAQRTHCDHCGETP